MHSLFHIFSLLEKVIKNCIYKTYEKSLDDFPIKALLSLS